MLKNGNFEADWSDEKSHHCAIFPKDGAPYEKDVPNIFVPPGWTFWFYHDSGIYDQPEGRDAWKKDSPERVRSGDKSYMWFTFNRPHDAGLFQQVSVGAGARIRFTAWAQAWSNHQQDNLVKCWGCNNEGRYQAVKIGSDGFASCPVCGTGLNLDCEKVFPRPNNGQWSEGAGERHIAWEAPLPHNIGEHQKDAKANFTFQVGIDPTGGTNPLADTVVWGKPYHIYNGYAKQLEVEAVAESSIVTVFIRSTALFPFKHNDAYVDDAELSILESQNEVVLYLQTEVPDLWDNVWAYAVSDSELDNVKFSVAVGGEDFPVEVTDAYESQEQYYWHTGFRVQDEGLHSLSVEGDTCSDVVSFDVIKDRGDPREQYARTYVLLPLGADEEWAQAVVRATWDKHRYTVGGSADDAYIGNLDTRNIICVNPRAWDNDDNTIEGFFAEYGSGVKVTYITAETPEELEYILSDVPFELTLSYPSTHLPVVITQGYHSEHHGLDFRSSWNVWGDKILAAHDGTVVKASDTGDGYGVTVTTKTVLGDVTMLIRYAHLVFPPAVVVGDSVVRGEIIGLPDNTGTSTADHLHFDVRIDGDYVDPTDLVEWPEPKKLAIGLHDEPGAYWMQNNGVKGVCLIHHQIQDKAISLNYRFLRQNGIVVIVRLNWGYADGTGTIAPPERLDDHLAALAITMLGAEGVDYFHAWNEPNNRSEWPTGFTVTKEYVTGAYNRLWNMVTPSVKLGLPPLDPYFGPGSNNMDWLDHFIANAKSDVWFLHGGKTQDNNPQSVWSTAKFSDEPLTWQYLNAKSIEPYLAKIPPGKPIFCTEINPQRRADGSLGWEAGNSDWVKEIYKYLSGKVAGAVFYRYDKAGDQGGFGLCDDHVILDTIKTL